MKSRTQYTYEQKQKVREYSNFLLITILVIALILLYLTLTGFTAYPAPGRTQAHSTTSHIAIVSTGYENGTVNLRLCPSVSCKTIAVLNEGTEVLIAPGTGGAWLQVLSPTGQGWVYGKYVEVAR